MRKIHLLLALTLFSAQASAEWELIDDGKTFKTFADKSTIRKQGQYIFMWYLTDFKIVQKDANNKKYLSSKTLNAYDCQMLTSGFKSGTFYDGQMGAGDVVWSFSQDIDAVTFGDVVPDTINEALSKIACAKK